MKTLSFFSLLFLSLFLCTACRKEEDLKTTRAEKWNLLENSLLFHEKESIEQLRKIELALQRGQFFRKEASEEEAKAWKEVKRDFYLDHSQILKADTSFKDYKVLSSLQEENTLKEFLSNDMEIQLENNQISIFFPKENSGFRLLAIFQVISPEKSLFIGKEYGSIFMEEEAKISFDRKSYSFLLYQSPLSERAWEKVFLLAVAYQNQFVQRNHINFPLYEEPLERKQDE